MHDQRGRSFVFGEFRLNADDRSLWKDGEPVNLPPKAIELLILLVERNGQIVSREDIISTIWADTFVEDGNINVTISLLRKTIGEKDLIQTIPRRGYRFTGGDKDKSSEPAVVPPGSERSRPRKSILYVVAAGVLSLFVGGAAFYFRQSATSQPAYTRNIQSIAILPLKSLSDTEADNTVAMGFTDSLISKLGGLRRFAVRPLSAVERFARGKKDPLEFGIDLKCDAIVVGTYQNIDGRLRVNLRMIGVSDGGQLWSSSFDEPNNDIFGLQDRIALEVAGSLVQDLSSSDDLTLGKRYTTDREAYLAYLRGRSIFDRRVENGFQRTLDEYNRALALDPAFALAYSGLADLFTRHGNGAEGAEAKEDFRKAKTYASKAIELDPDLSEAHASMGRLKRVREWDWSGAERSFKKAIELNPNNSIAIAWYAQMLAFLGRHDEALAMIDRAIAVDPITPSVSDIKLPILEASGRFEDGLKLAEQRFEFDKENMSSKRAFATFCYHVGQYEKTVSVAEEVMKNPRARDFVWLSLLAAANSKLNKPEISGEFLTQLEELSKTDSKALYSLAVNYAELGRNDDAIAALETSFDKREERLVWMNVEPRFQSLRGDHRFKTIVERIGL